MKRVAIVIGHKFTAPGAVAYTGESEFSFNSKIAEQVAKFFDIEELQVFYKMKGHGFITELKEFNPSMTIELHFNSFHKLAYGCEALALKNSIHGVLEANKFTIAFSEHFGIRKRQVKELTSFSERGHQNLQQHPGPSFIFEPCFANFKTEDSQKIIGDPDAYVSFLVNYFTDYLAPNIIIEPIKEKSILTKMIELIRSWF